MFKFIIPSKINLTVYFQVNGEDIHEKNGESDVPAPPGEEKTAEDKDEPSSPAKMYILA